MTKKKTAGRLLLNHENGWERFPAGERDALEAYCRDYRDFVSRVKTEREASDEGVALAEAAGFRNLDDLIAAGQAPAPGDGIYASAAGKTLMLIRVGKRPLVEGLRIIGGHTDSPRLDLKPRPLYEEGGMALLDTHYYGGIIKYQWVTMPLALHGVVVTRAGKTVRVAVGEDPADPVFVITDLLPHLGKEKADKKMSEAITGEGLNVLFGSIPIAKNALGKDDAEARKQKVKVNVLRLLNEKYGIDEEDLASAELEIVPAGPARELGLDRSMLLAYGHDDRVCAYAAMRALFDLRGTPETTCVCILCDKEEIGSVGSTGMESYVFENAVAELLALGNDDSRDLDLRRCLRRSEMLSADVNAVHDPNYPDVSSPNDNMALLNHGVVLTKYTGSRGKSGSNDARAEYMARIRKVFDDAGVIWQPGELGKVDQGGGGTIAYMLARYEMDVVDCGVGLLAMHAPWEVAGKLDTYMAYKGYCAFYGS